VFVRRFSTRGSITTQRWGNVALARRGADERRRTMYLRVEFIGLRRCQEGSILRRRASHSNIESIRGDENWRRVSLFDLFASLQNADRRVPLLHRLWRTATSRPGHPSVHEKNSAGQPIDQFGDGTTRRDYTYIDDIIQGTVAALRYDGEMFDVFNLGESETIQLQDLIVAIEKRLEKKRRLIVT